jgi:DNA-nicking Smr family endonuclease
MARRKKRKKKTGNQKLLKKKPEIFNPLKGSAATLMKADKASKKQPEVQIQPEHRQEKDENLYFLEALADVEPLSGTKKKITKVPDPNIKPAHPAGNDELEALAHLSDLVSGHTEIDISFTDEYIEGSVTGFSQKLMQQLKKGQFPVQDYVDLHGLTKQDAETRVRDFLIQSYRLGLRCVLIVHGRGLNSEDHIPVLKKRLPLWLNRGPINKIVLAFSTARSYDGGAGAVYVLLKRNKP